ncbi:MAG TPA: acetate--CoA ligase family protein [Candidatus Krumholzibacteria bacterium]|nr:acetate--CoA ligase family protein [Candidatus Krumholzibacteria bacterium]HPD71401.1 acetate--CoA ligase family protein [Candidatus Krumholzibacteria bacterium]HRY41666.1 acetate--CoA ligase family protein [Candidatus Krumholzibacteria bacterium]
MQANAIRKIQELLARARAADAAAAATRLNEWECYRLLDLLDIRRGPANLLPLPADPAARLAWAREAAALADRHGRLLVKVCGRRILHKTELGGVAVVDVTAGPGGNPAARIAAAAERVLDAVASAGRAPDVEGLLACGFVEHRPNTPGQELLLTLRQDPAFGPVVVVGIGGTLTEWYGQGSGGRSTVILPARELEAAQVAAALRRHPLLSILAWPSRLYPDPPLAPDALIHAIVAFARLGATFGPDSGDVLTLEELEVNPAVASDGRLVALDGVGLVSERRWPDVARPVAKIRPLLEPQSAVVMGVSSRGTNPGRIILENLLRSDGPVRDNLAVIHPKEARIAGVPCYRTCAELPAKVDLAVVAIPAEGALAAITELVATDRAESIILIPGGFAETGEQGLAAAIEEQLARGHAQPGGGPVMVGGNCLGIVSREQYNTFFIPLYKLPFNPARGGNLAVVSQSGAYLVTFASNYDGVIQPRASVSYGNQMDLTVADFLAHFLTEPRVDVIACYIEGFRPGDGARFLEGIRRARAAAKRVVVFKAGKTELGARAAASHTASLAGDYAVARACLAAAGADVADTLDEFEDLIKTFTLLSGKPARGRRVGVLTNAGFECSTVTDALGDLDLAEFDAATLAAVEAALPPFAHRSNPVDATPIAATDAYAAATAAILTCPTVDAAILSAVPVTGALETLAAAPDGGHGEDIERPTALGRRWLDLLAQSDKPAVAVVDSGHQYTPLCRQLETAGVPVFRKIDRAARALAAYCRLAG